MDCCDGIVARVLMKGGEARVGVICGVSWGKRRGGVWREGVLLAHIERPCKRYDRYRRNGGNVLGDMNGGK